MSYPEQWRPVEGFSAYEVSNLGRVKSLERDIQKGHEHKAVQHLGDSILSPMKPKGKQYCVMLYNHGFKTRRRFYVARLVWNTFKEPIDKDTIIKYRDGDISNCALDNLYSITRQEMLDGARLLSH